MRFGYLYNAGRWQLKSVIVEGSLDLEIRPLTHILVKPQADQVALQTPEGQALNQKWRAVFLDESP